MKNISQHSSLYVFVINVLEIAKCNIAGTSMLVSIIFAHVLSISSQLNE